jgi:phosphoribosylanthranilate isomerase
MREIEIKVCGLKNSSNIAEVAMLKPQYMGFILYKNSPRYVSLKEAGNLVKHIPPSIQKVGVLVNEPIENAIEIAQSRVFDLLQLHGNENIVYCRKLSTSIGIIKAFSISEKLPENLSDYQSFCRMFLFDTAGEKFGGTGKMFDHKILSGYSLDKGFILSGGISTADSNYIKSIKTDKMVAVDLNSRFEVKPGVKDINLLKKFIEKLRKHDIND